MKEEVRELRLDGILESIEHGTSITERTEGLNNLKTCFDQPSNVDALTDKSYHRICEILFKTTLSEKTAYLSTKKGAKAGAATLKRLILCADVLRQVVKVGIIKLKPKTIEAVVDHITQTLPKSNGGFFEPLIQIYLRTLNIIFERPANVEHLKNEVWLDTVDFCLQGINHYLECNDGEPLGLVHSFSGLRARPSGSRAQSVSSNGPSESQASTLNRQNLEEVFQILLFLVSSPNVPLFERYAVMTDSAIRFLQLQGFNMGHSNLLALSVINAVLQITRSDRTSFSLSVGVEAISIIARFWQGKSVSKDEMLNSVRDEMMILLFLVHPHLERAVKDGKTPDLLSNLESLVDVLRVDHTMRSERDSTLQLDDLEMSGFGSPSPRPFRLNAFQLRSYDVRAERQWANLQIIGILEQLVDLGHNYKVTTPNDESDEIDIHPSKRQRVHQTLDRLLEPLRSENENMRLCGLQFLPFIIQNVELPTSALSAVLGQLRNCVGDNRGTLSSWALLAIASCTFQNSISKIHSSEAMQLWRAGMRCLSFSATCRASALALHALIGRNVVHYQDVGEDVGSIVSAANTSGPALLCDSSILLMAHLLHTRVTESPSASLLASKQVIQWFFTKWNPVDKDFAIHHAVHIQPHQILVLLRTALGLHQLPVSVMTFPCGPIAEAWQNHLNSSEVIRYLLLLKKSNQNSLTWQCPSCPKTSSSDDVIYTLNTSHFQSVQKIILEPLCPKSTKVLQDWKAYFASRTSPVSVDMYRSTLYCCITLLLLTSHFTNMALESSQSFATTIVDLSKELVGFQGEIEARDPDTIQALRSILIQTIQPILPSCGTERFRNLSEKCSYLLGFLGLVADENAKQFSSSTNESFVVDEDFMDLDDDFSIRKGQSKTEKSRISMPRQNLSLELWQNSFNLVITGKLHLIASVNLSPDNIGFVPTIFIDYLVSLKDEDFLASRHLIKEICLSDLILNDADAARIIERSGKILYSVDFDRCEVALSVCVDILADLDRLWSSSNGSEVADTAFQIYQWLIKKALGKGVASPDVQRHISRLLLGLLRSNPDYETSDSIPSPRSSLFGILQASVAPVKFYIGNRIHEIFELFSLNDHDAIFVDILENLPSDKDWIEGISFRLFVLAKLGSMWPTLLRRSIYHIFETPGRVPGCLQYATKCLEDMALILQVNDAQELFTLFSPQLLYTWLAFGDIREIPYQIFGFARLRDLVESAKDEATALMVMRGQDEAVQRLAGILELEEAELLQSSFTKVMAYTVAYAISTPPQEGSKKQTTGEARVKKLLGLDVFNECINRHFADIIAVFFSVLDQDSPTEKYFMKSHTLKSAAKILENIKKLSSSDRSLPPNQQPTFKAKFLSAEIEHMCRKTEHESPSLYTPALVTSIVRKLFQIVHPALGSLHACAVLRKIRIVVSLAGDSAIQGYPLEMLLQSIRPFLMDPECADDAMGILQYLLSAGAVYLLQVPSFVAGITLSILGSLRSFLEAAKASTTQESQHKKTLSKAQEFHKWMGQYLRNYNSPSLKSGQSRNNFQLLIESALEASPVGNADRDTAESRLLLQLLRDEQTEDLLSRPSRNLALSMLTSNFQSPNSFRNDLLGSDELSMAYASVVWKTCRGAASKQYQCWSARVLGRAFAASGHIHENLLQESSLSQIRHRGFADDDDSVAAVLNLLQELTLAHDITVAGLAESALRYIVANADEALMVACQKTIADPLLIASSWMPYQIPPTDIPMRPIEPARLLHLNTQDAITQDNWLRDFSCAVAQSVPSDPVLAALVHVLSKVPGFAERAFPFILHLILSTPYEDHQISKKDLSTSFMKWLSNPEIVPKNNLKMIINSIIYLRTQPIPSEKTSAERANWLEIDYAKASKAATSCGMFKTALLFFEEFYSQPVKSSRRSSAIKNVQEQPEFSREALLEIYENIDDPDLYYGVQQHSNLNTILARFEYEKNGPKSLAFRGAQYDNHVRRNDPEAAKDIQSLVRALDVLDLNGLSNSLLQAQQPVGMTPDALKSMFQTARKLEQWDIPVPSNCSNDAVAIYKAFQAVQTAMDQKTILQAVNEGLEHTMGNLIGEQLNASALHESLQTLAALVEMDEVLGACGSEQFEEVLSRFRNRSPWMKIGRFNDVSQILSCRGTSLSTLSQKPKLREIVQINALDCRVVEVNTALLAAGVNRSHNVLQESLSLATSMIDLIKPCHEVGVNAEVAIQLETANALWDQGQMSSSIGMLQALDNPILLKNQTIPIGRSHLLSKIGHQISVARLEKPDQIIDKYLRPAIIELKGKTTGSEAGQVLHQFATFCDQQLQDPDSLEDLERLKRLSENKAEEVKTYDKLISAATSSSSKNRYRSLQNKAKTWLKLDQEELQRHMTNRDVFLRQCLENYLLALAASDDHNNNALRFSALWLQHSEEELANEAVSKYLEKVPSRKFAPLMNQLTSRLQDNDSKFQKLMFSLVLRICTDHPYHGMYQIYTGYKNPANSKDDSDVSRKSATTKVSKSLSVASGTKSIWAAILHTSNAYCNLAGEKDEAKYKQGRKIHIRDSQMAQSLAQTLGKYKIPSLTTKIALAPDCDYSNIPVVIGLSPEFRIASGISTPKILTARAEDGSKLRQLVKGGTDDLRQDAIMEQVFEQVSELLKTHRSTQQRNLSIRTYRVLPLTNTAGVIEFVSDTIPFHDYLIPAHERHYPKDLRPSDCRKEITSVAQQSLEARLKKYRSVTDRFHPVMRYFFTENFVDPDEWFVRRLAYTRSTAAISILGHILGLGDRHGHNILLDTKSGEVVHIDLGVAFEMGRILPVPELVPFRLTRDVVDGMGITKTEGVFRRCCEFTLEALREESYSIMSILDVLRYDPLHSWSISPVRLAKLQEGQSAALEMAQAGAKSKDVVNEPSEADRALTVVDKKLSKTLSVTATVNDLINQAQDERNLAVLFSGWAAYV